MLNFIKGLLVSPSTRRLLDDRVSRYLRLNQRHQLDRQGVSLSVFLQNPEHNQHWITVYFDNYALFKDRVELAFFIGNDPAQILKSLLEHRRSMLIPEAVCMSALTGAEFSDATLKSSQYCPDICFRGGRFIQKIKHHHINPRLKAHG